MLIEQKTAALKQPGGGAANVSQTSRLCEDLVKFSWVEVLPKKKDQDTRSVAVEVNSIPAKRQRYAVGVGYSSDARFHGLANWKARRINRLGHKGDVKLTLSSKEESLAGKYIVPGRRPTTDHSELAFAGIREQRADTTSRRLELGFNNVRQLGRWQRKLSLWLNREESELPDRDLNATLLNTPAFAGDLSVNGPLANLHLSQSLSEPVRGQLFATVSELPRDLHWQATLALFAPQSSELAAVGISAPLNVTAQASGTGESILATGSVTAKELPSAEVLFDLDASAEDSRVVLDQLALRERGRHHGADLRGTVDWTGEQLAFEASAELQEFAWPALASNIRASGSISASGTPSGYRFDAKGRVLGPNIPSNQIDIAGQGDQNHVELGRLSVALLEGELSATGRIGIETGELTANFAATGINPKSYWPAWRAATLAGRGEISVQGKLNGSLDRHKMSVSLDGDDATATFALVGGYAKQSWRGQLHSFTAGAWHLAHSSVDLTLARHEASASRLCLANTSQRICLQGKWSDQSPWEFGIEIDQFRLADAFEYVPAKLVVDGELNGSARIAGHAAEGWQGSGAFFLGPGAVRQMREPGDDPILSHKGGQLKFSADGNTATGHFQLSMGDDDFIRATASITTPTNALDWKNMPLQGKLLVELRDLRSLHLLSPTLASFNGRAAIDLTLAGTLGAPALAGQAKLTEGHLAIEDLGVTVDNIVVTANAEEDRLRLLGNAQSGDGSVDLTGEFSLPSFVGGIQVKGKYFRAADLPGLRVDVSPSLNMSFSERELRIAGDVVVPTASITRIDVGQRVNVSPDQVIVGDVYMLRYKLGSEWTLEATSGESESADLRYNIER